MLWGDILNLKRVVERTDDELDNIQGIGTGIRDMIPIPGTRQRYKPVFEKLKESHNNPDVVFTEEEFRIYCRNLIHIPDNLQETCALLGLLNEQELKENLDEQAYQTICSSLS